MKRASNLDEEDLDVGAIESGRVSRGATAREDAGMGEINRGDGGAAGLSGSGGESVGVRRGETACGGNKSGRWRCSCFIWFWR